MSMMGVAASTAAAPPSAALDPDQIADAIRTAVSIVLEEKAAEAARVPVEGVYSTFGFPVDVDGRKDAALTRETLVVPLNADLGGGKLVDKGLVWVKFMPCNSATARSLENFAICELSPDVQGRSDHKKATPICYNFLDHYKPTSSKLMKTKVLQQVPGPSNLYRVISEAEAGLFLRMGNAQQGALTNFLIWEVNKYNMYGPDDNMNAGMPMQTLWCVLESDEQRVTE